MKRITSIILLMALWVSLLTGCNLVQKADPIEKIVFDKNDVTLRVGESTKIGVTILPEEYSGANLVWDSTNTDVAIVMNGTISAISEGKTIISATSENGKMDMCIVIVEKSDNYTTDNDNKEDDKEGSEENKKEDNNDNDVSVGNEVGQKCPSYSLELVNGNETVNINDFIGKKVIVNFWGVWCGPSKQEMVDWDKIASEYKNDVVVLAVHTTSSKNDASAYISKNFSNSDIIFACDIPLTNEIDLYFNLLGGSSYYPRTVILDENGIITFTYDGKMDYEQIVNVLEVSGDSSNNGSSNDTNQGTTNNPTGSEKDYTLGLGIVFGDITNKQLNATIATVVTDANGAIVACKIDAVQNKYSITENGVKFTNLSTKKELGYKYNLAAFGSDNNGDGIVKEWFEQAAIFEQYVVGKTVAELKALEYQEVNNHWISKDDDLLTAGCTIQIGDFVDAVVKACEDEQGMAFKTAGEFALGLGVNNSDNGISGDDFEVTVKMNIDFAATVVVDGKIVAALNDAAQPQATIVEGEVTATVKLISKREFKEDYKMAAYGSDNNGDGIVKEWYQQSAAFSKYIVGMTASEVANMKTQEVNQHFISADHDLLSAGCTIQITEFQAVVVEAADNAK